MTMDKKKWTIVLGIITVLVVGIFVKSTFFPAPFNLQKQLDGKKPLVMYGVDDKPDHITKTSKVEGAIVVEQNKSSVYDSSKDSNPELGTYEKLSPEKGIHQLKIDFESPETKTGKEAEAIKVGFPIYYKPSKNIKVDNQWYGTFTNEDDDGALLVPIKNGHQKVVSK